MDGDSLQLLSIPPGVGLSRIAIEDALSYFGPDAVCLPGEFDPELYGGIRSASEIPVIAPRAGTGHVVRHRRTPGGDVVAATEAPDNTTHELLSVRGQAVLGDEDVLPTDAFTDATTTVLVVPDLAVEYDTTTLSARLPRVDAFRAMQNELSGPLVVLAGEQPVDYHHLWAGDSVPVHGLGGGSDGTELTLLSCTARGDVAGESVDADSFGLRAIHGVGPKTARELRKVGITTRSELAATPVSKLVELPGVGRQSAERMHAHVDVVETGEPLRSTNESLPTLRNGRPPLCLDIETDGLSPTVVWQVGVYDPETDEYTAFVEDETPTDPGRNVRRFCDYLFGTHAERTILTWNGDGFDFPVIERFLRQHAPEYVDAWDELWKRDLYAWAVRDGNALLPGRTNKLDDVARALGYEDAGTGITGAQTAAAYQRFMRAPDDPAAEPDWERHRRYCEDDCRALWHVWRAIEDAERRDPSDNATDTGGQQTGLTDF